MMYGSGYGAGEWLFLLLGAALIIIGIIVLVGWLARSGEHSSPKDTTVASEDQALRIARERLARGEITQAEYEDLRRVLVD